VTTVHGYTGGDAKNRLYEWLQRRAFRQFGAVVAVSKKLHDELVRAGVPEARTYAVPNAWRVPPDLLSRQEAREALGLSGAGHVVGWIGRMSKEKGPDIMVRSMARIGMDGPRLSMIGAGPLEAECRSLASGLGLDENVTWHGIVAGAGHYLRAFDAVVLTSWTEGTPVILLEAMGAGVPLVTTAVGGIPDVVGAEQATLVAAGDVDGIAHAIEDVLSNPGASERRAAAARERLEAERAVRPWVERYQQIYALALGSG
jgi:glycosyltransferase involved in cell wall biosynthesis